MSINLYDEALVKKLQSWTKDTAINILRPDETSRLFEIVADHNNDNPIKLPLIAITRDGGYTVTNIGKRPLSYRGIKTSGTPGAEGSAVLLNAIPISISYRLDVYTRYLREADDLTRNLIFNFINYPNITVELPYNDEKIEHDSTIHITEEIQDNSDIPERLIPGQFTRMTIGLTISDAYIWDVRVKNNLSIDPNITIYVEQELVSQ